MFSRLFAFAEYILVATKSGQIQKIYWNGKVDVKAIIKLTDIPFYYDPHQSRGEIFLNSRKKSPSPHSLSGMKQTDASVHIIDMQYSSHLPGLCIVLSSGRAAVLNITEDFEVGR